MLRGLYNFAMSIDEMRVHQVATDVTSEKGLLCELRSAFT